MEHQALRKVFVQIYPANQVNIFFLYKVQTFRCNRKNLIKLALDNTMLSENQNYIPPGERWCLKRFAMMHCLVETNNYDNVLNLVLINYA